MPHGRWSYCAHSANAGSFGLDVCKVAGFIWRHITKTSVFSPRHGRFTTQLSLRKETCDKVLGDCVSFPSGFALACIVPRFVKMQLLAEVGESLEIGFYPQHHGSWISVGLWCYFNSSFEKPAMCYEHPNGRESLANYPSIFCGEKSDHLTMPLLRSGLCWLYLYWVSLYFVHTQLGIFQAGAFKDTITKFKAFASSPPIFALMLTGSSCHSCSRAWVLLCQQHWGHNILLPRRDWLSLFWCSTWRFRRLCIRGKHRSSTLQTLPWMLSSLLAATKSIPTDVNIEADFANYFMIVILLCPSCKDLRKTCSNCSTHSCKDQTLSCIPLLPW